MKAISKYEEWGTPLNSVVTDDDLAVANGLTIPIFPLELAF